MRKRILRSMTVLSVLVVAVAGLAISLVPRQGTANSFNAGQWKEKKLRDIAVERDVEISGESESHSEYTSLEELTKDASAIVYGRIIDSKSFFEDRCDPVE